MSLAVITDSSVNLPAEIQGRADVYVLDIPVIIEGQPFVEGKNLDVNHFYEQMANSEELLKTSQPNLADLDNLLMELEEEGYTHVIGLFLSSGISGFWANSQFLIEDHAKLKIAFPDTKITAAPMGAMVRNVLHWSAQGMSFENILKKLEEQVDQTTAYILVDDLNHLVKGGRLSNGSAILGNLLSIKPILNFNDEGKIVVFEKVRTEKKAVKRLVALAEENREMELSILHTNAPEKAEEFKRQLEVQGISVSTVVSLCAVIATHLGEGALVLGLTPKFTKKVIVAGFKGRMGSTAVEMVKGDDELTLAALLDPFATEKEVDGIPVFTDKADLVGFDADVWVDFTMPAVAYENTRFALENGFAPVVGTTGFTEAQIQELTDLSKDKSIGGLIAPNFAIGAILLMKFAAEASKYFPDLEIIELHHDKKKDAPSGTAVKTAELIREVRETKRQGAEDEVETLAGARGAEFDGFRIHSVRLPGLVAHQEVIFGAQGEGLTLRHDSYDRISFMGGVNLGIKEVVKRNQLVYGLEHLL